MSDISSPRIVLLESSVLSMDYDTLREWHGARYRRDTTDTEEEEAYNSTSLYSQLEGVTLAPVANTSLGNTTVVGYEFYQTLQLTFLYVIFVCIVTGNISVIIAIFMSKARKSRMHFFILHLAAADLLTGMITVVTDLSWKTTVEWHAGLVGCKIIRFLQSVVVFAANYILVALSIDRLDAIARPMNFSSSGRRAKMLVCAAWALAFLFSAPMGIIPELTISRGLVQCYIYLPEPWHWKIYITTLAFALFIIPAIIISTCYIIIVVVIWSKGNVSTTSNKRQLSKRFTPNRNGASSQSKSNGVSGQESTTSSRGMIPKARIKTIKMTFAIVTVFIICWVPFFVFDLADVYGLIPRTKHKRAIAIFIQSLATLNSATNPIIYFLFSKTQCSPLRKRQFFAWLSRVFCLCCDDRGYLMTSSEVSTNPYVDPSKTTPCSEMTSVRRHSITPFVRVTLNQNESAILLKHLPRDSSGLKKKTRVDFCETDHLVTAV